MPNINQFDYILYMDESVNLCLHDDEHFDKTNLLLGKVLVRSFRILKSIVAKVFLDKYQITSNISKNL